MSIIIKSLLIRVCLFVLNGINKHRIERLFLQNLMAIKCISLSETACSFAADKEIHQNFIIFENNYYHLELITTRNTDQSLSRLSACLDDMNLSMITLHIYGSVNINKMSAIRDSGITALLQNCPSITTCLIEEISRISHFWKHEWNTSQIDSVKHNRNRQEVTSFWKI
ncbi:hypothetical protein KSF78_0003080 [Schistosoma japonicum]|nr:hypothetical protein KSF78_0003080 [Schistosoma japonicum]